MRFRPLDGLALAILMLFSLSIAGAIVAAIDNAAHAGWLFDGAATGCAITLLLIELYERRIR